MRQESENCILVGVLFDVPLGRYTHSVFKCVDNFLGLYSALVAVLGL